MNNHQTFRFFLLIPILFAHKHIWVVLSRGTLFLSLFFGGTYFYAGQSSMGDSVPRVLRQVVVERADVSGYREDGCVAV